MDKVTSCDQRSLLESQRDSNNNTELHSVFKLDSSCAKNTKEISTRRPNRSSSGVHTCEWTGDTKFLVLINHSDHDVSWVSNLKFPHIIYTKQSEGLLGQRTKEDITLSDKLNTGILCVGERIDETNNPIYSATNNDTNNSIYSATNKGKAESNLLKFIIDYYHELPENIIVVHDRDRAFYHEGSLLQFLNDGFELKYQSQKNFEFWNWNTQKLSSISMLKDKMLQSGWWKQCMEPWFGPLDKCNDFSNDKGAYSQFVVNRDRIMSLPRNFYENMYNWISTNVLDEEPVTINAITKFQEYPENWNHPNSNHNVSIYLSSSWEFIFTVWKITDVNSVALADGRKFQALYGSDGYYRDISKIALQKFYLDGSVTIPIGDNFNEIFGDHLYGSVKSLCITIDNHTSKILENHTLILS